MILAPCPSCGGKTTAEQLTISHVWYVACDETTLINGVTYRTCGYRGPFGLTLEEAVRKHNHISQKCGAV